MTKADKDRATRRAGLDLRLMAAFFGPSLLVFGELTLSDEVGELSFLNLDWVVHLVGFLSLTALALGCLLAWNDWLRARAIRLAGLLAVLPWAPAAWWLARATFQGGQARAFAMGGAGPLLLTAILLLLLHAALSARERWRCRSRGLFVFVALGIGLACHLADRRLYVGLYPAQHAALSLTAFLAMSCAALELAVPRERGRLMRSAFFLVALLAVGAGHVSTFKRGNVLQNRGLISRELVSTRSLVAQIPYPRRTQAESEQAGLSPRRLREIERIEGARARLAELRPEGRIDVVILSVDAMRADHTSLHGFERDTTPNLLELAEDSIVFEGVRSPSTVSFYSIASMLGGVFPRTIDELQGDDPLYIGRHLAEHGYESMGLYSDAVFTARPPSWPAPDQRLGFTRHRIAREDGDVLVQGMLDALDAATKPTLVFAHLMDPHSPYDRRQGFDFGDEELDRFHSELAFVDDQVRVLVEGLRERGRLERTILVVTADHGEGFGEHGHYIHGGPPHEEQCHVPLLVRVPWLEGGRRIPGAVSQSSLPPTLLDLLGLPPMPGAVAPSLGPQMLGVPVPPHEMVALCERPSVFDVGGWPRVTAVVHDRWKLIHDHDADLLELYDLVDDPGEQKDLVRRRPEVLRRMLTLQSRFENDNRLLRRAARASDEAARVLARQEEELRSKLRRGAMPTLAEIEDWAEGCGSVELDRFLRDLLARPDAELGALIDELVGHEDARLALGATELLGLVPSDLRRERLGRVLRLRDINRRRAALHALADFPVDEWKLELLCDLVRFENHDEMRILAGLMLIEIPGEESDAAMLDALAYHPGSALAFALMLAQERPAVLENWDQREGDAEGELVQGQVLSVPVEDERWRQKRILITVFREPKLKPKGDRIELWGGEPKRLIRSIEQRQQGDLHVIDVDLDGETGPTPPFEVRVLAPNREPGEAFGKIFVTLIDRPTMNWKLDRDLAEGLGGVETLTRMQVGWSADYEHPEQLYLTGPQGIIRNVGVMIAEAGSLPSYEIWLRGGARDVKLRIDAPYARGIEVELAAGERRELTVMEHPFADLGGLITITRMGAQGDLSIEDAPILLRAGIEGRNR